MSEKSNEVYSSTEQVCDDIISEIGVVLSSKKDSGDSKYFQSAQHISTSLSVAKDYFIRVSEKRADFSLERSWGWLDYIKRIRDGFIKNSSKFDSLLLVQAISDAILDQVKSIGFYSTTTEQVEFSSSLAFQDASERDASLYRMARENYFKVVKFVIIEDKLVDSFQRENTANVDRKFVGIQDKVREFNEKLDDRAKEIEEGLEENKRLLDVLQNDTGFAALYKGFDDYISKLNDRLFWAHTEKWLLVSSLIVLVVVGVVVKRWVGFEWEIIIPGFGIAALISLLLKVIIKKIDQLEQIHAKVEHKLAVSSFYENRMKTLDDESEKQVARDEYYNFVFSKLETNEWNAPDLMDNLLQVIRAAKK